MRLWLLDIQYIFRDNCYSIADVVSPNFHSAIKIIFSSLTLIESSFLFLVQYMTVSIIWDETIQPKLDASICIVSVGSDSIGFLIANPFVASAFLTHQFNSFCASKDKGQLASHLVDLA
ncbi:hypothetical protein PHYBLDRAFT_150505 [Phycomyces blakesleeanus NRRL 1555(-)]|uniref:Uncharacterized protein n=1 Tax=Phycomyces blakesleeanus (strain ATCC 8743b / DSM 1359 / FGSC 10004 / NBRC 33097 / NRRL 1555) TaxID=763407 RepID=A0A162ZQ25_PHYB8|nr:hypothetical protein PHYBLDRAFT_150505 [Phycomyces blakesleeanus NRRL 1555(-)]OAD68321.1 hypothetical protein PHYBLDRAFT_150505 [Phycomyces blakesleeanus NRRL 1555(-)]|eukprot:XP_018286361.1 hypothetical protein PHYBLDRAFT_150505 [Phycomyces blakesleeanus NRRL 1555(-)]